MAAILLGPQRLKPTVGDIVRDLAIEGVVATVTAGWQEREPDDAELDGLLDHRSANLSLYARWHDAVSRDPELAAADRRRRDVLEELQAVYGVRLHHAMEAVYELQRRVGDADVNAAAQADAFDAVRALDARHLERVAEVNAEFYDQITPDDRSAVAEHRVAVVQLIEQAGVVAIAGGHVGALVDCLHLFNVAAAVGDRPVVAWSAGAMAVTEHVVLFHDRTPHGHAHAEAYTHGLALCRGVVALPHARRRLRIDDRTRMAVLARRFAPARCLVLDDGASVDCRAGGCPPGATVVRLDGRLEALAA